MWTNLPNIFARFAKTVTRFRFAGSIRFFTRFSRPKAIIFVTTSSIGAIVKKTRNEKCLDRQNKLLENIVEGDCVASTCHAGVTEYVSPVVLDGKKYGIVCLSGYKKEGESGRGVAYDRLSGEIPTEKRARALITPVVRVLKEIILAEKERADNAIRNPEKTVREVMRYVAETSTFRLLPKTSAPPFSIRRRTFVANSGASRAKACLLTWTEYVSKKRKNFLQNPAKR